MASVLVLGTLKSRVARYREHTRDPGGARLIRAVFALAILLITSAATLLARLASRSRTAGFADDTTALGRFDGATLTAFGVTTTLTK